MSNHYRVMTPVKCPGCGAEMLHRKHPAEPNVEWWHCPQCQSNVNASVVEDARRAAAHFGRMGGKARASRMTPDERSKQAKDAVQARWAKSKQVPLAPTEPPDKGNADG